MRCRDHGSREDRQKTRLMWLVEEWGTDKFREMVGQQMGGVTLRKGIKEHVRPNPISLRVLCLLCCATCASTVQESGASLHLYMALV